ncbi:MAG: hypothetical protein JOZ72_05665 [Alphaproteobacteria bacterium]|nr:hypothetical protein [Alphaproteobacteria bacterium]
MAGSEAPDEGDGKPALDAFFGGAHSRGGLRNFLNSPFGLALVGFVLTTGLGTFLTDYWHSAEKARDDRAAHLQVQEDELRAIRTGVKQAIVDRQAASEMMIQALESKAPPGEVSALWQQYMQAYRQEITAYSSNQLNLEGISDHTENSEVPVTTVFWHYLDYVIQPRFADLHDCIVSLRRDYDAKGSTTQSLQQAFGDCETRRKGDDPRRLYWDQYVADHVSVALWGNFKTCLSTYSYYLDWHVRLQSQVWNAPDYQDRDVPAWYRYLAHPLRSYREEHTPPWEKPVCWQHNFLNSVRARIAQDCGVYPHGKEDSDLLKDSADKNPACDHARASSAAEPKS